MSSEPKPPAAANPEERARELSDANPFGMFGVGPEEERKTSAISVSGQPGTKEPEPPIDPPTEHKHKHKKRKHKHRKKKHTNTEFLEVPGNTSTEESQKRGKSTESGKQRASTEERERPGSTEPKRRLESIEAERTHENRESERRHDSLQVPQRRHRSRKHKRTLESIEAERTPETNEPKQTQESAESKQRSGNTESKIRIGSAESIRFRKESTEPPEYERKHRKHKSRRHRKSKRASSKEGVGNEESEKHRKSKRSSSNKPETEEPRKHRHSKKRQSSNEGVGPEKRRHSGRRPSNKSDESSRLNSAFSGSSLKSGEVRRSESEELRELLKSDGDDRASATWSQRSDDSDDEDDLDWEEDQLFRPLYSPVRNKRLIHGRFDVSDVYGEILLPGELIETSSDSTQTKEAAEKARRGCFNKCRNTIKRGWESWHEISSNEEEDAKTGYWDHWVPYYCLLQGYNPSRICWNYVTWLIIIFISHNRQTDLIYATYRNGGFAYITALMVTYLAIGWPMMIIETLLGQYSGRRTIRLFRFLSPALSGIGWALYIRTLLLAMYSILFVVYTSSMIFDFYFCSLNTCRLLKDFTSAEKHPYTFTQLGKYVPWEEIDVWHENAFFIYFLGYTIYNFNRYYIRPFSKGLRLGLRLLFTISAGSLFLHYHRIVHQIVNYHTLIFAPMEMVLTPKWERLYHARTWLDALSHVSQTCFLGTMVHPYLGSKLNFHYRAYRDLLVVLFFAIIWSFSSALSLLLWMGYVIISKKEMLETLNQFDGWYGRYITILRKSNQASMSKSIDPESNFFIGFHYSTHAVIAVVSSYVMIHVLIHSSYTQHCIPVLKKLIFYVYLTVFIIIVPIIFLLAQGLRHLMFWDYFLFTSFWPTMIVLSVIWFCVAYGHSLVKFVMDVRNMVHLRAYGPFTYEPLVTYVMRANVGMGLVWTLIWTPLTQRLFPITKRLEFKGLPQYIGLVVSLYPFIFMSFTAYFYLRKLPLDQGPSYRPHFNWYKNYGHTIYCFYNRKKDVVMDILTRCKKAGIKVKVPPIHLLESTHVQGKMLKKPEVKKKQKRSKFSRSRKKRQKFKYFPEPKNMIINPY